MRRALSVVALSAVLAGCGSHHTQTRPEPKLPRALAHSWSREATAVAAALASGNACLAQQRAERLLNHVVSAINARRIPQALLEQLTSSVNALAAQITCPPSTQTQSNAEADARNLAAWLSAHSR